MYADDGTNEPVSAVPGRPGTPALHNFSDRGSADPATLRNTCRCGARWSGNRTAHCAGTCHLTFTGVTAFDDHRRNGKCLPARTVGLVVIPGRAYEVWGYRSDDGSEDHAD